MNDAKRQKIFLGDTIEFIEVPQQTMSIKVKVKGIIKYDSFEQLYEDIPFKDMDCESWTMQEMVNGTYEIYTRELEKEWGALAIKIEYIG